MQKIYKSRETHPVSTANIKILPRNEQFLLYREVKEKSTF